MKIKKTVLIILAILLGLEVGFFLLSGRTSETPNQETKQTETVSNETESAQDLTESFGEEETQSSPATEPAATNPVGSSSGTMLPDHEL